MLPADLRARPGLSRLLALPILGLVAALVVMLAPAIASADSSSTVTIVGTSDVTDSGLFANVIKPGFQAAFPGITINYNGSATGAAIQAAENGTGGPSALVVHAASLENQFVAGGFSLNNSFGNAIFRNDFIVAGTNGDVAGVGTNATHNIAQAFADVAAAGVAGNLTFDSRGGTNTAPGTTVEEHQLWALMASSGLTPSGVFLCQVSGDDGGGETPITQAALVNQVTNFGNANCPDSGIAQGANLPSWYRIVSGNQANNVTVTNACTGTTNGSTNCYLLTDRGTFDFLSTGGQAGGPSQDANLSIVARDNDAAAPGGPDALLNYFHVYIINPNKPGETVNVAGAQDLVSFLTSPAFQASLRNYLASTGDPGGAPFIGDASPGISSSGFPSVIGANAPVTVSGTVQQPQPGFPALSGQPVSIDQVVGGIPVALASGSTNGSGAYSITFVPKVTGAYQVATGALSQVENPSLSPVYGDIVSPAATAASTVTVQGSNTLSTAQAVSNGVTVVGAVGPSAPDGNATVAIMARTQSSKGAFKSIGTSKLTSGQSIYAFSGKLAAGKWTVETVYQDGTQFVSSTSATKNITVQQGTTNVSFKKTTIKTGKLTVSGALSQGPVLSKAKVVLLALQTTKTKVVNAKTKKKKTAKVVRQIVLARVAAASFKQVGKSTIGTGKKTFTIKGKLKRGFNYVLELEYVHSGQPSTFSKLKSIAVH
jgi:tungstate transport system substrate-binding protein